MRAGFKEHVKGRVAELEMDPKLKEAGWEKYAEFKIWFDKRLDAAIKKVKNNDLLPMYRYHHSFSVFRGFRQLGTVPTVREREAA